MLDIICKIWLGKKSFCRKSFIFFCRSYSFRWLQKHSSSLCYSWFPKQQQCFVRCLQKNWTRHRIKSSYFHRFFYRNRQSWTKRRFIRKYLLVQHKRYTDFRPWWKSCYNFSRETSCLFYRKKYQTKWKCLWNLVSSFWYIPWFLQSCRFNCKTFRQNCFNKRARRRYWKRNKSHYESNCRSRRHPRNSRKIYNNSPQCKRII